MTREELEADLRTLPEVYDVSVIVERGSLIATVVSGAFVGQNDAVRQAAVWGLLRSRHDSSEYRNVEFIFTNAPGEAAEAREA